MSKMFLVVLYQMKYSLNTPSCCLPYSAVSHKSQLLMYIYHGYSAWMWSQTGDSRLPKKTLILSSAQKRANSPFSILLAIVYCNKTGSNMATTRLSNVCTHIVAYLWYCETASPRKCRKPLVHSVPSGA